ncbi:MAG TPA: FG-GAP-like repeat-containing protein, partial [Pyrinomonadaceae bacterium]|nr:FG-GAP-like repeat-containing protein [Pyrinomonadaceae bacterium]
MRDQARNTFVRLNADASLDLFPKDLSLNSTGSNYGRIRAITVQPDGKILLGGYFTSAGGRTRRAVVRINPDGTIDTTFGDPGIEQFFYTSIAALVVQPDGKILVGGDFDLVNGQTRRHIIRLNTDGSLDTSFNANVDDVVYSIGLQPDGKVLISGFFSTIDGQQVSRLSRLNANGSLDTSFNRGSDFATAYSINVLPDGKILAPGSQVGLPNGLFRYNANGTRDTSFTITDSGGGAIQKSFMQPDGKIIIIGGFFNINGQSRPNIARLNANGTLDTSFQVLTFNQGTSAVADAVIQPDGKILIVGSFSSINGTARKNVARLNADGSLDATFSADANSYVYEIALQADTKILLGGDFTEVNGIGADFVARLMGGATTTSPCAPAVINFGQTINGNLGANGCGAFNNLPDGVSSSDEPKTDASKNKTVTPDSAALVRYSDYYTFTATAGQQIAISMSSTVFDTYLYLLNSSGTVIAENDDISQSNTNSRIPVTGFFTIPATGTYTIRATSYLENATGSYTLNLSVNNTQPPARAQFDFDGDGKTDVSVFRPSNGAWYIQQSQNGFTGVSFGTGTDIIVPADYDGDGKTDVAVFRSGIWYLQRSQLGFTGVSFGDANDIPTPADYDGDGKADIAVFRPSNGAWYLLRSSLGFTGVSFGQTGDKPVAADYDGDGKADVAVFRSGTWYINRSSLGFTGVSFGEATDKPVPADYDGDGKADIAVFRSGTWYLLRSSLGFTGVSFGLASDLPTPGDYDGDGKADVGVFRP